MSCQWLYNPIVEITAIGNVIEMLGNVIKMFNNASHNHCQYLLLYKQLSSGLQVWTDFYSAGSVTY